MTSQPTLTETQDKLLSILPCFTSCLSCLGSAQIIYMVLTGRRTTPYRRILLGLSSADFLCSVIYPLQAFLLPQDTSHRIYAVGNDATCTFLGFAQQSFFASIFYNSMLSVYFLLTVRFGLSNEVVGKKYEPMMHVLCIGYPLITAVIGVSMNMFHELELGHGCWVNNYPEGCDCAKGQCCREQIVSFFFGGLPALAAFSLIAGNNLLVYWHVRKTIQKSVRRFQTNLTPPDLSNAASAVNNTTNRRSLFLSMKQLWSRKSQITRAQRREDPQLQRVRAVATQASFYVGAFMITYLPAGILRVMAAVGITTEDEGKLFPLLVIQSLLLPSQGFFNVLVYLRPSFWRTRRDYPHETVLWAVRRALYGEKVQPNNRESIARPHPSSSDFGGLVVIRQEAVSVLAQYGLANAYPENYWSHDEDDNAENGDDTNKRQIRRRSSPFLEDVENNNYRGDIDDISEDSNTPVVEVEVVPSVEETAG